MSYVMNFSWHEKCNIDVIKITFAFWKLLKFTE